MRLVGALVIAGIAACARVGPPVAWPDAPLQLRDDADRDQAIDQLWVLPTGAERDRVRAALVDAIARRITDAIEEDKPFVAEQLLFQLASLWQDDAAQIGRGLAGRAPLLERVRRMFARSGNLEPTICATVMLGELDPARRDRQLAELDEVLGFADDLAAAENGAIATRAQPIALLQPTVLALPLPWLVDRYVGLVVDRQRAIAKVLADKGASMELVRAHHDIVASARRIAIALARAGRAGEIHARLAKLVGLGADRELAIRAEIVADQPTPDAFLDLARALRSDDKGTTPDPHAALAVELAGLARFPRDAALATAAAGDAQTLGRVDQPIALYETALRARDGSAAPEVDQVTALRIGKLYAARIARLAEGGRPTAATQAWRELASLAAHHDRRHPDAVWSQIASTAETALGRGLLRQGRVADAEHELHAALARAPSIEAYEALAALHLKTDRLASAGQLVRAGLALLGDATTADRYHRAKLERLAGDIARAGKRPRDAAARYLEALRVWASLGEDKLLTKPIAAERKLEFGRVMWFLGDPDKAIDLIDAAIDVDRDSAQLHADAVELLLELGRYHEAIDVVHHALGTPEVGELHKVYTSLWLLADGRRRGEPRDRLAWDYLASRHGDLWYERLAEAATGRLDFAQLRAAATTAPRQAELAFYGALLGLDRTLATPASTRAALARVVAAGLVMDPEFDLARHYLSTP